MWPEPRSSAAGTRMLQLVGLFQNQGFEVVFASAAQESDFSFHLKSIGVALQKIALNDPSFDVFVKALQPNIVLFDRYVTEEQFGWRVAENCPNSLRILDTEDLHTLRKSREKAIKKNLPFELSDLLEEEVAKREIASVLRSDVSLIISEFEMGVLQNIFKIDPSVLFYLPLFYDQLVEETPKFQDRKDFVFIGNFLHEPNWDAVKQLKQHVWPLIRAHLPEVNLHIYGAYPSQKVLDLNNPKEGFCIHGRAQSAIAVLQQARVLVAPIRFGAGLKGKLLEAMQVGTPSVTTSIGAEAINDNKDWNGYIEDDFTTFANKAVLLYQESALWSQLQKKGYEIIQKRFQKKDFENLFFRQINTILEGLTLHRKQNFMGNLLLHHNLLSIKYMSRWIEEKNKIR